MLFKILSISLAVASATMFITQANAVWLSNNLRNGLTFGISGTVNPSLTQTKSKFSYVYGDPTIYGSTGTIERVLADQDRRLTDERARIGGFNDATIYFGVEKRIHRDMSLYGNVGLYGQLQPPESDYWSRYFQRNIAYQYGINLMHDKYGSIGFNANPFDNSDLVNKSGFNGVLDNPVSAISAKFTGIPNLTVASYYNFPSAYDTRNVADTAHDPIHEGYGISADYTYSFAPRHNLAGAIGFTDTQRHAELNSNTVAKDKTAQGIGLSYQYEDWTVSANYGKATETFDGSVISDTDIDSYGLRVNYEITPRLNTYAIYGKYKSDKHGATDTALSFDSLKSRGVYESNFFDQVDRTSYGIGADYQLYNYITLKGGITQTKTENYITEGLFSKREATAITAGASFSF